MENNVFIGPISTHQIELDVDRLLDKCYKYRQSCIDASSVEEPQHLPDGRHFATSGWIRNGSSTSEQYYGFKDEEFSEKMFKLVKEHFNIHFPIRVQAWLNINHPKDFNDVHGHTGGIQFLSGVYYLKAPKDSGDIQFYSHLRERGLSIAPKENRVILFPCETLHGVEVNNSSEDRVSIAFNIQRRSDG